MAVLQGGSLPKVIEKGWLPFFLFIDFMNLTKLYLILYNTVMYYTVMEVNYVYN